MSSCQIGANTGQSSGDPNRSTIVGRFEFLQYDFELINPNLSQATYATEAQPLASGVAGRIFVNRSADNSLLPWATPSHNECRNIDLDYPNLQPEKFFSAGDVHVVQDNTRMAIPQSADLGYSSYLFLPPGPYQLKSNGHKGTLMIDQDFWVPGLAFQISLQSGAAVGSTWALTANGYSRSEEVTISRSQDLIIRTDFAEQVPEGTQLIRQPESKNQVQFVKVAISDGVSRSIQCYGIPGQDLRIPQQDMQAFRDSDQGVIFVYLVSQSLRSDFGDYKESFVRASSLHMYGKIAETLQDGRLIFAP